MKKLFYLFNLTILLTACSSDDSSSLNITNADLIGTWNLTAQETEIKTSGTIGDMNVIFNNSGFGKDFDYRLILTENPNQLNSEGNFKYVSITISNIPGIPDVHEETLLNSIEGLNSGSWSLNGDTIMISDTNNETIELKITEFTGNILKLSRTIDQIRNSNNVNLEIKGETNITLEK